MLVDGDDKTGIARLVLRLIPIAVFRIFFYLIWSNLHRNRTMLSLLLRPINKIVCHVNHVYLNMMLCVLMLNEYNLINNSSDFTGTSRHFSEILTYITFFMDSKISVIFNLV